jgi:hypothetical protein
MATTFVELVEDYHSNQLKDHSFHLVLAQVILNLAMKELQ